MSKKSINNFRICICGPRANNRNVGGLGLAIELLIQELDRLSVNYRFIDVIPSGSVRRTGSFSLQRCLENIYVVARVWLALLRSDIYYTNMSTSKAGFVRDFLTVAAAGVLKRRVVMHLHGGGFEEFYTSQSSFFKCLIRRSLARVDRIIVLGEKLRAQFDPVSDIVGHKLCVVPNGLSVDTPEPRAILRKFPSNGETIQLLYMSSLMESKGYLDVIKALRNLLSRKTPKRYHLHLCGGFVNAQTEQKSGPHDEGSLKTFISTLGLDGCVTVYGQVNGGDKVSRFKEAHVFLLPTAYQWEGQPLSIIEALAYSLPVITCPHKGIPEQVDHGFNGFMTSKDADSIAEAIIEMFKSQSRYEEMCINSRKTYESKFKRDVHLENLLAAIRP